MNPICRSCGTEAQLQNDAENVARWWCPKDGFRKLHQLNFVLIFADKQNGEKK